MNNTKPLNLPRDKYKLHKDTKGFPMYPWEALGISIEEHLENFNTFYEVANIEHKDIFVRIFIQIFIKEALH